MTARKYLIIFFFFICLLTIPAWTEKIDSSKSIHICGSSTILPIAQLVAEEYMKENPGVIVVVSDGGSLRGIKSVIQGTADIAMSSTDISEELLKLAESEGIELADYIIAYDGVTPIVNPANQVSTLSVEQLKNIFTGEIKNWKDLGGADMSVVVTSPDAFSGTYEFWKNIVMGQNFLITPKAVIMNINSMKKYVSKNKNAIGYISLDLMDNTVKPLAVNGSYASVETITKKTYPLRRELKFYTLKKPSENVAQFIKYFLKPEKGQNIVLKTGNVPINK